MDGGFVEGIGVGGDADEESSEEGLAVGGGRGGGFPFGGADEEIGEDAEVFVGRREVGGLAFVPAEGGAGDGGVAGVDVESESEETARGFSGGGISCEDGRGERGGGVAGEPCGDAFAFWLEECGEFVGEDGEPDFRLREGSGFGRGESVGLLGGGVWCGGEQSEGGGDPEEAFHRMTGWPSSRMRTWFSRPRAEVAARRRSRGSCMGSPPSG